MNMRNRETRRQKHARLARHFLEAADELFEKEDYPQTSEKLWGAASHAIRALCIQRRWHYGRYAHLQGAARRLTDETGDPIYAAGFGLAWGQHRNFYWDDLEPHHINFDRPQIRDMVEKTLTLAETDAP